MRLRTLVLASVFALAACGSPEAATNAPAADQPGGVNITANQNRVRAQKVDAIAALVPADIRTRGTLVVGTTGNGTPPLSFRADDDKTVIGVEPDLAQLVADVLGLKLDLQASSWENLFLSVENRQFDAGFSNITVTEERKDKYDFATYRKDTIAFEVKNEKNVAVKEAKDIAGLTVGVGAGTNQEQILLRWDQQNKSAGLAPVKFQYYQATSDYYLALQSGRIDAYVGPNPTSAYHVAVEGKTKIVGTVSGGGTIPADIAAMTKKDDGLVKALQQALDTVIKNGQYAEVLKRWNLASEALPASEVNPQGLPRK
ncbi:putative amino acid ABC transporter, substrate-binding protein [Amycolatopsis sp. NBRC 101858]|uniref:ABC transporter substrate-binding protein n=1 Tax=Amycolatopsis sp. NBRC 101858 TaxID=3032200 RepID=UPI0024A4A6FE|nr:ABC transporter substrate-binding protein [Amycolatopsis sp. NBRC 101858]GLY37710.1 putative amino acid ABC transporter, substrate-binding protein [Amycolatopsis sp. NBRC 101858]